MIASTSQSHFFTHTDNEGLRRQSSDGANIGFTGKQVIHPNQIAIVQECFSPSTERVSWANELLDAYEQSTEVNTFYFYHYKHCSRK